MESKRTMTGSPFRFGLATSMALLLLLIGVLSAEWTLRRKRGLA